MLVLSRLDFSTTDLAMLRAALRMPEDVEARATRMVVDLAIEGGSPEKHEFLLDPAVSPEELQRLSAYGKAGARIVAYRLPAAAVKRFEDIRQRVGVAKAEKRKGALSVRLEPDFCYREALPREKLVFSSYLATSETRGYVPLLVDFDAFSRHEYAEKLKRMPKC
jgi:hypothetical protein